MVSRVKRNRRCSRLRKVLQPTASSRNSRLRWYWQRDRDARRQGRFQEVVKAGLGTAQYPPFTNSGNTPGARRPKPGADNSAHCGNTCSNGLDSNSCSSGPGSDMGNTVHGNNKPKPAPKLDTQHRELLQTVAEADFS